MNKGLAMLEEALRIGGLELASLEASNLDQVTAYAEERGHLIAGANAFFQSGYEEEFRERLLKLQELQNHLNAEAGKLHAFLQAEMKKGKAAAACQRGYNKVIAPQAGAMPTYMNKVG